MYFFLIASELGQEERLVDGLRGAIGWVSVIGKEGKRTQMKSFIYARGNSIDISSTLE